MYLRLKSVRGRRYAYLVEGQREGNRVRQKVVRYLGPLSRVGFGIPESLMVQDGEATIDWKSVNEAVARIPMTFDELSEARLLRYPAAIRDRRMGFPTGGTRGRVRGEEDALVALASAKFGQAFTELGKGRYRMK